MAWHHLLFELSLILNIVITVVYWSLLHEELVLFYADDDLRFFQVCVVHLLPLCCSIINLFITDIVFIQSHAYYLLYVAVVYSAVNFVSTKMKGEPVYSFLTWEDSNSLIMVGGIFGGALFMFKCLVLMTESLKNRSASLGNKLD
mmetsp:Transcript_18641/g.17727  ORF Transcript_18641/g.17727 Transcript_18641/m.17727 type:complete len:145 (+) Transcript_18641:318-752(+)